MTEDGYHDLHERPVERFGDRIGGVLYTFVASLLVLEVSRLAAYLTKQPLLFPSLGPTAFLFFELPMGQRASPAIFSGSKATGRRLCAAL